MRMCEIYYNKLEENGMLGESTYPFTSEKKSNWTNLKELTEYLFEGFDVEVKGSWVTVYKTDENDERIGDGEEFKFSELS